VAAVEYSNISLARQVARQTRSREDHWVWLLPILAGVLMDVALARPQFAHGRAVAQVSGIDIMLALDVSSSMQALDFKIDGQPAIYDDKGKEPKPYPR
jgi:Ca-activated chloride channel family protein